MTDELIDLEAILEAEGGNDHYLKMSRASKKLKAHVIGLIKARQFTATGDESHLSVSSVLAQAANIDQPRKYDFQTETVHEEEFLRTISGLVPSGLFGLECTAEEIDAAIAGTASLTLTGPRDMRCYDCAVPMRLTVNANSLHFDCATVCEKNGEFYVDVDFPTGEVVFGDWPDRFSEMVDEGWLDECDDDGAESINYIKGQRYRTEGFAKQGIFHLSVGNSCPSWYYDASTGEILIGGSSYNEDTDEETLPDGDFKDMGSFCTDLWWVTMLDRSRYDELISKLPKKRNKKYYDKTLDTATIKPGRYRFHSVPMVPGDDDYRTLFAKAEYLGPCGELPKVKRVEEGKIILNPMQMVLRKAQTFKELYPGRMEAIHFSMLDDIFNGSGSGINSKGDFFNYISVPADTKFTIVLPPSVEAPKHMETYVAKPYPNFKERYSLLYEMQLKDMPIEWVEAALWFYTTCRNFFLGDKVGHYHYAYPSAKNPENQLKQWTEALEKRRKEGQTDEQFYAAVTKDYETEYNGDLEDFLKRHWEKELNRILKFISKTRSKLNREIKKRKAKQDATP